ncbi:hypothetical protein MBRA_00999 [Methylobacterium brachiatum]|nr:hypothetical protein MBRA_00999 [Methylobacterium brachiatum]
MKDRGVLFASAPTPDIGTYPYKDHARNAKARAAHQEKAGKLSAAAREKVDAKADKVLGKS